MTGGAVPEKEQRSGVWKSRGETVMHELGIVLHIAKTLEDTAKEENLSEIASVTLQVGEVSGIMTDYFTEC